MLVDKMKEKPSPKGGKKLSKEQETDAKLASTIGLMLITNPDMEKGMIQLVQSGDPVAMLGQFIGTTIIKLKEQTMQNGLDIDDMVWMAKGGVTDRLIDQAILNLDAKGMDDLDGANDAVAEEVLNVIKLAGKIGQGGGQQQPQGGAPMGPEQQAAPQQPMGPPLLQQGGMV